MFGFARKPKVEAEAKGWSISDPSSEFLALFGAMPSGLDGEDAVGSEAALRVPAVSGSLRVISETVASLDIRVKRVDGEAHDEHPVYDLLSRPNPWTSAHTFRRDLVVDAIRHGVGFAMAVRAGDAVRELHRGYPGTMSGEVDHGTGEPRYRLTAGTQARTYGWRDVVAVQPIPNGPDGQPTSLLRLAADAIGFAANLNRHGRRLFANGARPGGLLKFTGKLSKESGIRWRDALEAQTRGANAGRPIVLGEDADWKPFGFSSVDAQFLELWKFVILEIARVFRVPPHMLADLERTTHSNAEEMNLQFIAMCIRPWCELICGALQRVVFTDEEQRTHYLEFDFGDLLRPNTLALYEAMNKAVAGGVLTPDEAREQIGRPKVAGGDKLRVPLNTVEPGSARDLANPSGGAEPVGKPELRVVS